MHISELETPAVGTSASKADESRKLEEILRRPEYAHQVAQENAISRLVKRFFKWILSWLPRPKPMSLGGVGILSRIAQWVVILLALGVLAFVLRLFLEFLTTPLFFSARCGGATRAVNVHTSSLPAAVLPSSSLLAVLL